jgi:hypothetical protein
MGLRLIDVYKITKTVSTKQGDEKMKRWKEKQSNKFEDLSIEELEERLEMVVAEDTFTWSINWYF